MKQPEVDGQARQEAAKRRQEQQKRLKRRMGRIRHKVVVLSGKGGVGKSTVAANMAVALAEEGFAVGLLDADIHGPSAPTILDMLSEPVYSDGEALQPPRTRGGVRVMSMAFLLQGREEAVIWRGPMKMNALSQLLADVEWGDLDFLVLDLPPGTGDEPLSVCQLLPEADGGVVVTTPQEMSLSNVRRCIDFCRQLNLPVLGVLENMSGFVCPNCGEQVDIFGCGGGRRMAERMEVPFIGAVPTDPAIVKACDAGRPFVTEYPDSSASRAFREALEPIVEIGREGLDES
ncbi:MAG: P-loop NTPase [Planctomycetota bacterium]